MGLQPMNTFAPRNLLILAIENKYNNLKESLVNNLCSIIVKEK